MKNITIVIIAVVTMLVGFTVSVSAQDSDTTSKSIAALNNGASEKTATEEVSTQIGLPFTFCNEIVGRSEGVTVIKNLVDGEYTFTFVGVKNVYFYADKDDTRKVAMFGNVVTEKEIKKFQKTTKTFSLSFNCTNQKGQFIFGTQFNRYWSPWN